MNSIPEKIKALHFTFDIVFEDLNAHNVTPELPSYGYVDWESSTIFIDNNQPLDRIRDSLWHEVTHVAWGLAWLPTKLLRDAVLAEEMSVALVSTIQLTILRENPKLANFLLAESD